MCLWQHQYHTKSDEFLERVQGEMAQSMVDKLVSVLDAALKKMANYDEGSFMSSILSLTVSARCQLRRGLLHFVHSLADGE